MGLRTACSALSRRAVVGLPDIEAGAEKERFLKGDGFSPRIEPIRMHSAKNVTNIESRKGIYEELRRAGSNGSVSFGHNRARGLCLAEQIGDDQRSRTSRSRLAQIQSRSLQCEPSWRTARYQTRATPRNRGGT